MNCNKHLFFIILVCFYFSSFSQYTSNDWKSRDRWMKVDELLNLADLKLGDTVADVGSHEGYLTMHLSKKVKEQGHVYAVDVRNDRLEKLKKHARNKGYKNITTVVGAYDDPKLPKAALNAIFVIDTYHEMTSYKKMLQHFKNALKTKGKIVLLEKIKKHMIGEPRERQVTAHTLSLSYVKKELQEAGFIIEKEITNFGYWERDKTKTMWILVAMKP